LPAALCEQITHGGVFPMWKKERRKRVRNGGAAESVAGNAGG
jgi:hypothetical protein